MCLSIVGRLLAVWEDNGARLGNALFGEAVREVNLALLPDAGAGDYVVVHSGFAVSTLSAEEADEVAALQAAAFAADDPD